MLGFLFYVPRYQVNPKTTEIEPSMKGGSNTLRYFKPYLIL